MNGHLNRAGHVSRVRVFGIVCCLFVGALVVLSGGRSPGSSLTLANAAGVDNGSAAAGAVALRHKVDLGSDIAQPFSPLSFIVDDGSIEYQFGWGSSYYNTSCAAIWLNRFSPTGVTYPITLDTIKIPWPDQSSGTLEGRTFQLLVYTDADADGNPANASLIYQSSQTIHVHSPIAFDSYPVDIHVTSPADIYVGWEDSWAQSEPGPFMYPASVDATASHGRSYVAANTSNCSPNIDNLGHNQMLSLLDNVPGLRPANLLVRASGNDCAGGRYTDVCPSDYFATAVTYLSNRGAISGYSDGSFHPYDNTTRAQLCKIVVIAEGWPINTSGGPHFSDVPASNVFYPFVETAFNRNIISGYSGGLFKPSENVSRGQICKIIVLAQAWAINTSGGPHFSDVPASNVFYPVIETAYNHHIISGFSGGTFQPGTFVTRGQLSKILYSALVGASPDGADQPVQR